MTQKSGKGSGKASSKPSGGDKGAKKSGDKGTSPRAEQRASEKKQAQAGLEKAKQRASEQKKSQMALEKKKQQAQERTRKNQAQGDRAERKARKVLRDMGFDRSGLGLHYGRQGLDAYGIRNTPKGKTMGRMEVKSTRDRSKTGTEKEVKRLLKVDSKGLQQGSRLYGEERLRQAASRGNRVARNIRSGQALAGEGRIQQSRDYVYWTNVATGKEKAFRVISTPDGKRVQDLKEITGKKET